MRIVDIFQPIYSRLPEVKSPEVSPPLKKKLMWTGIVLLIFFVMGEISLIGVQPGAAGGRLQELQLILASDIGTLITAGIGPIVLASIILQLLVGGKIISLDMSNPQDKIKFMGLQKLFAIILCIFEGIVYSFTVLTPLPGMLPFVILQIALGSIVLLYLDEVVSKYGIGSGIGLFIAGGVSSGILWRALAPPLTTAAGSVNGIIPLFIESLATGAQFIILLPIVFTIIIFLIVVYAEGMHVNIPITMGTRGMGGRFPVKFLYVSNLPVILAVALFANIQLWAMFAPNIPLIGAAIKPVLDGVVYFITAPYGLLTNLLLEIGASGFVPGIMALAPQILQAAVYIIILVIVCVVFGKFWVEMGGQGATAVAGQLQKSGMYIPGFRRDQRIIEGILKRYIPPITILGSAFVGLLAGFADLTGALGTGTGILLTVGIVYRLYEELAKEQVMESNPLLGKFFGG